MKDLLLWIGRIAGVVGFVLCAVTAGARVTGTWTLGGVPVGTLFLAGVAAMVLGCLAYTAEIAERARH